MPWIHDVIGEAEALVVKPRHRRRLADLEGKKIATPFASTSHYSLLAALEEAGVDAGGRRHHRRRARRHLRRLERGDIDGAYVWNPNLAKIIDDGGKVLITSAELAEEGKTTYDLAVVTNEFAEEYPERRQDLGRAAGPGRAADPATIRRRPPRHRRRARTSSPTRRSPRSRT